MFVACVRSLCAAYTQGRVPWEAGKKRRLPSVTFASRQRIGALVCPVRAVRSVRLVRVSDLSAGPGRASGAGAGAGCCAWGANRRTSGRKEAIAHENPPRHRHAREHPLRGALPVQLWRDRLADQDGDPAGDRRRYRGSGRVCRRGSCARCGGHGRGPAGPRHPADRGGTGAGAARHGLQPLGQHAGPASRLCGHRDGDVGCARQDRGPAAVASAGRQMPRPCAADRVFRVSRAGTEPSGRGDARTDRRVLCRDDRSP